jgi:hypothetical protein
MGTTWEALESSAENINWIQAHGGADQKNLHPKSSIVTTHPI